MKQKTVGRTWWKARMAHPVADAMVMKDPRVYWKKELGVVAFFYQGEEAPWDIFCCAGCLGNFFDLQPTPLQLEAPVAPGRLHTFYNAEAAFCALGHWSSAADFAELRGSEARQHAAELGEPDPSLAGFGSAWSGMFAVLTAKYTHDSAALQALLQTKTSLLVYHHAVEGAEPLWSDGGDGEGRNWLGLQLMLIRDRMAGMRGWADYLEGLIDTSTGEPRTPDGGRAWQMLVREGRSAIEAKVYASMDENDRRYVSRRGGVQPGGAGGELVVPLH